MRIGLLAYHSACNFGANLQLLSTIGFLKKEGHTPIVINWIPASLEKEYEKKTPSIQKTIHQTFRKKHYTETSLCRNDKDIANCIAEYNIEAIIIGSDAVAQHHPFWSRIGFPTKRIISFNKFSEDRMYPNPFWGSFLKYTEKPIKIAVLSASCQNSAYSQFSHDTINEMNKSISQYSYLSVRDDWTRDMYSYITNKKITPSITPDPVFALNYNVPQIPSYEEIKSKFNLPSKYILVSFLNSYTVSKEWCERFKDIAILSGYNPIALTFPKGIVFGHSFDKEIEIPLDPLDWYALIKYSNGYVGHNMHPIVVALHNAVPFFSFDNYGILKFQYFVNEKSSKIYHILSKADFLSHRISARTIYQKAPSPEFVLEKINTFDKKKCEQFAEYYYREYLNMMTNILISIK